MPEWMVFCEGPDDERTVQMLVDSTMCEALALESHHHLSAIRRWAPSMRWRDLKRRTFSFERGRWPHAGQSEEYKQGRKALGYAVVHTDAQGILLVRDTDAAESDPDDRRAHLEQARSDHPSLDVPVCLAVAIPKTEAWVIAGFDPEDADERERLRALRQETGFDPILSSHRLRAGRSNDQHGDERPKEAKTALGHLTADDFHRKAQCLAPDRLPTLRARGEQNGLKAFLDEVAERLLPQLRQQT